MLSRDEVVQDVAAQWQADHAKVLGHPGPAHPVLPTAIEWVAGVARPFPGRDELGAEQWSRAMHLGQRIRMQPGWSQYDSLLLRREVTSRRATAAGTVLELRTAASAAQRDVLAWESETTVLLHGVDADPLAKRLEHLSSPLGEHAISDEVLVAPDYALRYSEAARIHNPIHTDPDVARQWGLPAAILHGSATLGLAVTTVVRRWAHDEDVSELGARFAAPVVLPVVAPVALQVCSWRTDDQIDFEVHTDRLVLRGGRVVLRERG